LWSTAFVLEELSLSHFLNEEGDIFFKFLDIERVFVVLLVY
jgi:hypothetical protein